MLRAELRKRLLEERGIHVTEACDACGQLLGPVRYTRRGEPGEWCSGKCRGDEERRLIRKGGRPRKYRTKEQRRAAKTNLQRVYRDRLNVEKTPLQLTASKGLADAKIGSQLSPIAGKKRNTKLSEREARGRGRLLLLVLGAGIGFKILRVRRRNVENLVRVQRRGLRGFHLSNVVLHQPEMIPSSRTGPVRHK